MSRWALLVGPKGTGKSSTAARIGAALVARGVAVGGFVQEAIHRDGERVGYRLRRLSGDDTIVLARHGEVVRGPQQEAFCSYVFDNDAFAAARRWLEDDLAGAAVVILDEVSKLEIARKGHHDAIQAALATGRVVVLVVRADQLFGVVDRFALEEPMASIETTDLSALDGFIEAVERGARQGEVAS